MNNSISIPFSLTFDGSNIEEDQELQHLVDINLPKDLSIYRGGIVELLWKQHHDYAYFKNTYIPFESKKYLFSKEVKGLYKITSTQQCETDQILFVFNLNNFLISSISKPTHVTPLLIFLPSSCSFCFLILTTFMLLSLILNVKSFLLHYLEVIVFILLKKMDLVISSIISMVAAEVN